MPPIIAILLALLTKEVYLSLFAGCALGALLVAEFHPWVAFDTLFNTMIDSVDFSILMFMILLGMVVMLMQESGGTRAYGEWAAKKLKSKRATLVATSLLGALIFVDDYFNCLTVGAVMRPVTDRFKVSREKLSWIIDSTAAPVCIIAPVSSWAVAVGGYLGEDGFSTFVASIPYNFYALLTIFFVFFMCATKKFEFGPMKAAELKSHGVKDVHVLEGRDTLRKIATMGTSAASTDKTPADLPSIVTEEDDIEQVAAEALEEYKGMDISEKGHVYDLVIPIVVLIVFSILGMMYVGGFWDGVEFTEAVGVDPVSGLCIGATVALVAAAAMFLPRKLMKLDGFMEGISEGVRSMIGAIMILVLAWSLGGMCRYLLGTGEFVAGVLNGLGVGLELFPAAIFLVSAFIGFAMGTSWGTIALILPIVIGVFDPSTPLFLVAVGATLGGAVYGDHVSPISDTTILSSAGAKCNHLRHVSTQLPYATMVMAVCFVGYIIAGFTGTPWISLIVGLVLVVACTIILAKTNIGVEKA